MPTLSEEFCQEVNKNNMPRVVELIRTPGVDINFKYRGSSFPLYIAAMKGWKEIVRLLLAQESIEPNAITKSSTQTALHIAASRGHYEVCELLLPSVNCALQSGTGNTAYDRAKMEFKSARDAEKAANYKRIMGLLLTETLLHAVRSGDLELTKRMVEEENADVNALGQRGACALHIACMTNRVKIVDYLVSLPQTKVDRVCDINFTPLQYAMFLHDADRSRYQATDLELIIQAKIQIAQALIAKGADVNYRSRPDHDILHEAVDSGSVLLVKCLIENGADLTAKYTIDTPTLGKVDITLLHYAKLKNAEIASYIEEAIRLGRAPAPIAVGSRAMMLEKFSALHVAAVQSGGADASASARAVTYP